MKIDYVIISSDDNPIYKDFYEIVAKRWLDLGYKTYYINITDEDGIYDNEYGIVHKIKALDFISTGFQSQVARLFSSKFIEGNIMMSDIDMLPINSEYFNQYVNELTEDNVIIYSGQPYGNTPYYPMCYVLSNSKNFIKYLDIEDMNFEEYCKMLSDTYRQAWNTDENFMYDKFENYKDNLLIKNDRDFSRRIDRSNWNYNIDLLKRGHYIDSHMVRPYNDHKTQIDKLLNEIKKPSLKVVVAHYNKDISWIDKIDKNIDVEVYSSNKDFDTSIYKNITITPNKGMDSIMYLSYIVNNYYSLPDRILFVHHHEYDWTQNYSLPFTINNLKWDCDDYFSIGKREYYGDVLKQTINEPVDRVANLLKNNWYIFKEHIEYPEELYYYPGTQFCISKNLILQYNFEYWEGLYKWVLSNNLEDYDCGRIFEWCWHYILTKNSIEKNRDIKEILYNI